MHPADPLQPVLVPIDEIDEHALIRDRTGVDPDPLDELMLSIATAGLRQPIELFPLEPGTALARRARRDARWGLLSGFRRLAVFRGRVEMGDTRYAEIPAFIRQPDSLAAAITGMVEENAMRADISPYEQGLIAVAARDSGVFATLDEAIETLYRNMSRQKRSRLRQLAFLAEEIDGHLTAPERLSQQQALRLADALRLGLGEAIRVTLAESPVTDPAAQWQLILPFITEAENSRRESAEPTVNGRPRRVSTPRNGLTIRREATRNGYSLHFTGRLATSDLIDVVFSEIDRMFGPA